MENSSQKRMVIEMDRWMKTVVEIKEAPSPRKQFIANATRLSRRRDNKEKSSSDLTYHHAVPEILCGLIIGAGGQFIREIQAKSSASVYLARDKTPVEGMHIFVIRGTLAQVEEAVRLISQKTGSQGRLLVNQFLSSGPANIRVLHTAVHFQAPIRLSLPVLVLNHRALRTKEFAKSMSFKV
ncbi:hypothetical protein C0Q70_12556 [Pomacea canaliculata]|uniref:K Homology domain-containing protein n=1 Tax=Pomacea canaliculata TaxID=400727 RepID=A0A2T7P1V9_POMCA|nr:hypothetical protein C0Q70_12556 [Pomacea canaliculata]